MKALQATCIVSAMTFTGMIHQVGGNAPGATVPNAMLEAAGSAETPRCACALRRRAGGICRGFRTVVDGPSRNRRRFFRGKMDGLGPP